MWPFASLFSPWWAFVYSGTIHFLWPRIWRHKFQNLANWMRLGPDKKHLLRQRCSLVVLGLRRLETNRAASRSAPGSTLCLHANPMPCCPSEWHCPTVIKLSFSTLSLLFHGQLTLRLCFHFMLSTHWLIQIPCDPQHSPHDIRWDSWPVSAQKPNNVLMRKGHGLQTAWSTLLLKPFEDSQGRLCPWVLLLQSSSVLL